ncbi:uncharacterized protein LOC108197110 [Daucus carota subsp. sativus]|uniref:uncharacterized protein LOC108197110 n=1 Tax=Daucus carota subsp. sativus TaxID=79200 RepID=UPI0007EF47CC|nr:PREDICTED: uncharacterized protein LOC108197110 [Daucus carota subsp. sativus]
MLSRLQEASQYVARAKKKEKEKSASFSDEVGIGSSSDRFGYQDYQNSRFCNENSSTDCYDELRKVIRESLGRQNLLSNGSINAKAYSDRRETEFSTDLPSSNSSRTSTSYSHDSASVSSNSSNMSEDRPKASNLVAKLMGLEEISSMPVQSESRKQVERDKNLNPKGLIFDIDRPIQRKPGIAAQNGDRGCMTLEEIIQNMQFKGLLDRNQFQIYDSSESEDQLRNHAPPVVLMKPVHAGDGANDFFSRKCIPGEGDVDSGKRRSMLKTKEGSTSRILEHKIPETNVAKPTRKAIRRSADNKVKLTNSVSPRLQKDPIDKKVDKVPKSTSRRKPVEKENVKSTGLLKNREQPKSVSRSHEHLSSPAMKLRKSETGPSIHERKLTTQQNSTKSKLINKALASNDPSIVHKGKEAHTDQRKKADPNVKDTTATPQLRAEEEFDDPEVLIKDIYVDSPSHTTKHEYDSSCPKEHDASETTFHDTKTTSITILPRSFSFLTRVEDLFDNIDTYQPMALQILTGLHCRDGTNSNLLMDCANELLETKSQRTIPCIHPLIQRPSKNPSFCISADHLMQEVRSGMESLMSYKNHAGEMVSTSAVSALLQRDLWCLGRKVEAWDVGWRNGFTGDEVQTVLWDLDELILSELVAEVLAEICS